MVFISKRDIDLLEYDDFLKEQVFPHVLQTSIWAQVKNNWKSDFIGFYRENETELLASCLILTRQLMFGVTMCYIPRGMVFNYDDDELLHFILSTLTEYAKSQNALFVKFDPAIKNDETGKLIIQKLQQMGCIWLGETKNMSQTIQPRYDAVLYKENYTEEKISKKLKQRLRKAQNTFSIVEVGSQELLMDFAHLMNLTEQRKGIKLRGADYYAKILDAFQDDAKIVMVKLNLRQIVDDLTKKCLKAQQGIASTNNTQKKIVLQKEIERYEAEIQKLTVVISEKGEIVPAAGNLFVNFNKISENLYAGMDEKLREYYPSYLAWDMSIKTSFEKGAILHDMGGIEAEETGGLFQFKKMFNPQIEEYIGEFDIPVNIFLYKISKKFYRLRKEKRKFDKSKN